MTSAITDSDLGPAIAGDVIKSHVRSLVRLVPMHALLLILVAPIALHAMSTRFFIGWGAAILLQEMLRCWFGSWLLQRRHLILGRSALWFFVGASALSGLLFGGGIALHLAEFDPSDRLIMVIVVFAMAISLAAFNVASRIVAATYASTILCPIGFAWVALSPADVEIMPGVMIVFIAYVFGISTACERVMLRAIAIGKESDRVVDILQRRNAEVDSAVQEADRSATSRAHVLASASHDLRQPLHTLSLYSAVLGNEPSPDRVREVSRNIGLVVRSLGQLLTGLLDLSRVSPGHYVADNRVFALDRTIFELCTEYESAARAKALALYRRLEPVRVIGDPLAITRIVRNLLDNAVKYTESGSIVVTTRIDTDTAIVEVQDTGRGIPDHAHDRIFDEFYQIDSPGRDPNNGLGLGLAIVQRMCAAIGARILLESSPGKGSCFALHIPGAVLLPKAADPVDESGGQKLLLGRRILVVDDDVDVARSMSLLLETWGAHVDVALTPREASAKLRANGLPDLLILDFRLGRHESGVDLANRLQRQFGPSPVLFVTGETGPEALRTIASNGHPLLQKPVPAEVMLRTIVATIGQPDATAPDR